MKNIDRRKFLKISGSLLVGGIFVSIAGHGLWKMFKRPESLFYDSKREKGFRLMEDQKDFVSPYRRTFGFVVPDEITALEVYGGSIYVATQNNIYIYGLSGELQTNFPIPRVKNKLEALTHSKQQSSFCIKMCIEDIKHLEVEISSIEEEIEHIVKEHAKRDFDILTSIPGIGKKTACLFIAMTDSVKRFDNYKQVISYFGMSPRTYDSGTSVHSKAKICKVGLSTIRKNMYLCGLSARKYNKSCKDLYDRLVEKGKAKKLAIIAVANKIIKQAFALIKKQVFYDENFSSSLAF